MKDNTDSKNLVYDLDCLLVITDISNRILHKPTAMKIEKQIFDLSNILKFVLNLRQYVSSR